MSLFAPTAGAAIKFETPGDQFIGQITAVPTQSQQLDFHSKQPAFYPPKPGQSQGDPKMQIVVQMADQQGNARTLYVASTRMKNAISDAMVAAGARDIEPGGFLTVQFTGLIPGKGANPAKGFVAQYVPPAAQ